MGSGQDPRPVGGESLEDAANRAAKAVDALSERYSGKAVVVVTHSDICASLAGQAASTPFHQRYKKHGVSLGSFIEIVVKRQGGWKLQ